MLLIARRISALSALATIAVTTACKPDDKTLAAPTITGSALAPSAPKSEKTELLVIDGARSKVSFTMEAPLERIRGTVDGAVSGELFVDPTDLTLTTGTIIVDASKLDIYQRTRGGDADEFADEKKNETQNRDARQWLEIDPSAPADLRERYSRIELAVRSVSDASSTDLAKMSGATREVTLTAKGDFLLHGRMKEKEAKLVVTFAYAGDHIASASIKTSAPMSVGLAEFDVRPKTKFGVIAAKTLEMLSPKVARDARVSVDLVATPVGGSR